MKFIKELAGSFSSKVELFRDDLTNELWVLKTVPEEEIGENL